MSLWIDHDFHPFLSDAFVVDLQLQELSSSAEDGTSLEERLQSMTWCEICAEHCAEAVLSANRRDYGMCKRCGLEQWAF